MWVASRIASAPVLAIQGTVRAIWMAMEVGRREALAQVSTIVSLGTERENFAKGQEAFKSGRVEWRLR